MYAIPLGVTAAPHFSHTLFSSSDIFLLTQRESNAATKTSALSLATTVRLARDTQKQARERYASRINNTCVLAGIYQRRLLDSRRIRAASRMKFGFRMIFVGSCFA